MIDFTPAQAAPRIANLLTARESRTLDFMRVSGKMVGKALEASRMLRTWVAQGVLIALPSASRQQARYAKPLQSAEEGVVSLSNAPDNELQKP